MKHYCNEQSLSVSEWMYTKRIFSIEELAKILLVQDPDPSIVCTTQPVNVYHNVAFLVDITKRDDPNDLKADENGVWHRNGSPNTYITILTDRFGLKQVHRRSKLRELPNNCMITRTYYRHSASPDFSRIITKVKGMTICLCQIIVIVLST